MPGRWWTHDDNSNADMRAYASARGVPAQPGNTTLVLEDGVPTATTEADGVPVIRTTATVGDGITVVGSGRLRYVTEVGGELVSGLYFHAPPADGWQVTSMEFLEPDHPISALRPAARGDVGLLLAVGVVLLPGGEGPLASMP